MKTIIQLLTILIIGSCQAQSHDTQVEKETEIVSSGEFNLEDTTYFVMVKNYIQEHGEVEKINASSSFNDTLIITYYNLMVGEMKVSIDHTQRIYMNLNNQHFGNILNENCKVVPEVIYGIPDKNPQQTNEKVASVVEIYRELIILSLRKS